MTESEKLRSEPPIDSIKRFIFSGENNGVTSFLVKGPKSPLFMPHSYVSLMLNRMTGKPDLIVITTKEDPEWSKGFAMQDKVMDLHIPDEFERFEPESGGDASQEEGESNEDWVIEKVPLIVLAFGNMVDDQSSEEVVMLFSIKGIKPDEALLELQKKAKESKVPFN